MEFTSYLNALQPTDTPYDLMKAHKEAADSHRVVAQSYARIGNTEKEQFHLEKAKENDAKALSLTESYAPGSQESHAHAYQQGIKAGKKGAFSSDSPYSKNQSEHEHWIAGVDEGRSQNSARRPKLKESLDESTAGHPVFKKGDDTTSHVKMSLHRGGYTDHSDIHKATFHGMSSSGQEIHKIHFHNMDTGKNDTGNVYIGHDGKAEY